jgi:hypothetical protein
VELCKRLLDEINEYLGTVESVEERLELEMQLTVIMERVRELNLRCVP